MFIVEILLGTVKGAVQTPRNPEGGLARPGTEGVKWSHLCLWLRKPGGPRAGGTGKGAVSLYFQVCRKAFSFFFNVNIH